MPLPTGVAKRGDIYHLQIKVPLKLSPIIGRHFWVRISLNTSLRLATASPWRAWTASVGR